MRAKKDGKFLNLYIDRGIYEALDSYCESEDCTKTEVVELAVKKYLLAEKRRRERGKQSKTE